MTMSRAATALLAALAAAAAAAAPAAASAALTAPAALGAPAALAAPAAANCSRHIRVGVFDDANPFAVAFLTGWMDSAATACFSFHHMPTGNRAIERLANGNLEFAIVGSTPLTSSVTRGVNLRSYQRVHVKGASQGLVVKSGIDAPQDLRGKIIWVPITSTAHYIVLVALAEFNIDISSDITVEFKSPQEIREAWDAGTIDGAGCWGNTLTHLTSRPHGGTNETGPGHIILDAATVARWGYITLNNLVTTREKLYEIETDRIESGGPNLLLETLKYFARANYDYRYRPRPRPGEPEGVWGANGTYNRLAWNYLALNEREDFSLSDVQERMGRFEYPTALEQYTQGLEYHAEQFYDQADFAYRQKALALPPTREQFLNTVFSPETSVAIGADTAQASVEAILEFERTPLDEEPYPLPTSTVALVQHPVAGETCESYTLVDVSDAAPATFTDGSAGTNAYHQNAKCLWAISSTTGCVNLTLPFLATENINDEVEVFSDGGTLLARFSGRSTEVPEIVRCINPENGPEIREEAARSLAGPDAPVHDNVSMYVRWTSDDFDEVAVGAVLEPVGFTATASVAATAAPACKPGWGGASCDYPACFGIDLDNQRQKSGTIRSQPAGVDEYKPYSFCVWFVPTGDEATHVKFDFKALGLELIFDSVSIYRDADVAGYSLANREDQSAFEGNYAYRISGEERPEESIIIEGDTVVVFESDGMINAPPGGGEAGFELEWSLVKYDGARICPFGQYGLNCALKSCIGAAPREENRFGRIKSGIAKDYRPENTCLWQIDLPKDDGGRPLQKFALRFSEFDLELSTAAVHSTDAVEVYQVPNGEKALRSKLTEYKFLQSFARDEFERGIYDIGRSERLEFTGTANGTSIAIVFSTDMNNPQPHSGFDLIYSGVYGGQESCGEVWSCGDGYTCRNGFCEERESNGSSNKNNRAFPPWLKWLLIALACLFILLLLAFAAWRVVTFVKKSVALRREHTLLVHEQVTTAMDRIEELQAHLTVVPGETFLALGSLKSHESMEAETITYHTVDEVRDAQASGLVFAFLSHQWLGWSAPDPANKHYESMCCAVKAVAEASGVDVSAIRVWVDFVSIPQANRAEQRLAITSLPAFSACCDVFVVVAPEATHADTLKTCSVDTYKKRAWCRAEIFSFWARHGADDMYLLSSDGHLNQLEITDDCLAVFSGELTCCRLGHPNACPCDKEKLMLPMLGLFSVIYRDSRGDQLQRSTASGAYETIAPRLETLFPKTFEWVYEAPDGRRLTEELPLFGDLIDAAKYVVDLETAKDDDPIFKRAVPTFAPGTHARRKTHHQLRLLGRSQTPDAAKDRSRTMLSLPSQSARSGTNWMKGKSFKRLSHTRSDALSPGSSPASTHSSVDPRSQHRGAFFWASVANLDA